jgi:hypothetical protein
MASFRQSAVTQVNPASTVVVTFGLAVLSGNGIVAGWFQNSNDLTTVTDNGGGGAATWTQIRHSNNAARWAGTTIAPNVVNAPTTVTHTWAGSNFGAAIAHEVNGMKLTSPVDNETGQVVAVTTGTDNTTSGAVVTSTNGCYIFGCTFDVTGTGSTGAVAGTGYTSRVSDNSVATIVSEDRIQAAAGSIAATFSSSTTAIQGTFIVAVKDQPDPYKNTVRMFRGQA